MEAGLKTWIYDSYFSLYRPIHPGEMSGGIVRIPSALYNKIKYLITVLVKMSSRPSVTNVYYFFMTCRDSYRFVRCGFVYVIVCLVPRVCGVAHSYTAAQSCRRDLVLLPRTRMLPLIHGAAFVYAAAHPWCRAWDQMVSSSLCAAYHGAAKFSVLSRPMLPRSSTCCRVPWCRAVLHVAASHAAALRFYVRPRLGP